MSKQGVQEVPTGAKFHVTERDGAYWLAMSYPKQGLHQGAANKRVRELGDDLAFAEAVAEQMNTRVGGETNGATQSD
jgi:hypothetical protein